MDKNPYASIAAACLAVPNFSLERLTEELRFERGGWKVPGYALWLVDTSRNGGAEDEDTFADGSCTRATGTVRATTWWKVGAPPARVVCRGSRVYYYSLGAHSGGVEDATERETVIELDPRLGETESHLIRAATAYLLRSFHAGRGPALPRALRNFPYHAEAAFSDSDLSSEDSNKSDEDGLGPKCAAKA